MGQHLLCSALCLSLVKCVYVYTMTNVQTPLIVYLNRQLLSIEPSVTKANQKIVLTLIKLFADFKEKLLHDLRDKLTRWLLR